MQVIQKVYPAHSTLLSMLTLAALVLLPGAEARAVGELASNPGATGGARATAFSAETEVIGVGIMQSFEVLELQSYIAWRSYSVSGDVALGPAGEIERLHLDDFTAVLLGSRISF